MAQYKVVVELIVEGEPDDEKTVAAGMEMALENLYGDDIVSGSLVSVDEIYRIKK